MGVVNCILALEDVCQTFFTMSTSTNPTDAAPAVPKKTKPTKTSIVKKVPYAEMVIIEAIVNLNEKFGSSRQAIFSYISSKYQVAKAAFNRALARMIKTSALVFGNLPGRSGSGSYKISPEKKAM